ncbi:hypothetical protein [Flavobacterium sp. JP2137]|uniref:hypothetical protein n=1 Tax=Flavobacterium sp. JP2137 TaxID=3414510 RepID=UPI003D2FE5E6
MKNTYYLIVATILALLFFGQKSYAQDIIIKNDKEEIKAKVLEIEASAIKYKLFAHLDGPIYNLAKKEIFMIIYANGKRELFDSQTAANTPRKETTPTVPDAPKTTTAKPSTTVNTKPSLTAADEVSLSFWTIATDIKGLSEGGFNATLLFEGTTNIKNTANYFRIGYSISMAGDTGWTSMGFLAHLTPHLSINRMMHQYDKQNVGFFPYVRLGLGGGYTDLRYDNYTDTTWEFLHQIALGTDYIFSNKFAITVYTDQFKTFSTGLSFKF